MIDDHRAHAYRRHQRGLAMVEFAISVPVLLLLMFGTFEFGHFLIQYNTLNDAVRNAARYVAGKAMDGTTTNLWTGAPWSTLVTQGTNLAVFGNIGGTGLPVLPALDGPNIITISEDTTAKTIKVLAAYPYQPLF